MAGIADMSPRNLTNAAVLLSLLLVGCSGDKAKELLETAEFEERQMNVPHAKQLYEEVIRLYPSSPQAQTARERLAKLNAG
jgi:TolA-binding protein